MGSMIAAAACGDTANAIKGTATTPSPPPKPLFETPAIKTAGVCMGTYMFALPGSTGACKDAWDEILTYQLDIRHRPCNFVELMPRLLEE